MRVRERRGPAAESPRGDAGRLGADAEVRVAGLQVDARRVAYIRGRLAMRLGKFADAIQRISVRLGDVNAWRGGLDKVCRIQVALRGLPSVVIERRDAAVGAAIDAALDGTEQAVTRSVQRRRTRPIQRLVRAG